MRVVNVIWILVLEDIDNNFYLIKKFIFLEVLGRCVGKFVDYNCCGEEGRRWEK